MFVKIAKNILFCRTSSFFDFSQKYKKTTPDFFDEKSKTGLGFEIGQSQQKCQLRPTLQSMTNPGVHPMQTGTARVTFCSKSGASMIWIWKLTGMLESLRARRNSSEYSDALKCFFATTYYIFGGCMFALKLHDKGEVS